MKTWNWNIDIRSLNFRNSFVVTFLDSLAGVHWFSDLVGSTKGNRHFQTMDDSWVWHDHIISIPAYAIEQQWWQSSVPKKDISLMSLICKNYARSIARRVTMCNSFKNFWPASKWLSISFSHLQCLSNGDFSFPRFVGLLILSLWVWQCFKASQIFLRDVLPKWLSYEEYCRRNRW
jgi:hypothetical protein